MICPWRYPAGWGFRDEDRIGEDLTESEQIDALNAIPVWALYKESFPGLGLQIFGYGGRKKDNKEELLALPCASEVLAPLPPKQHASVPAHGTVFHHGLKPRTRVPSGYTLWTNHAVADRRFPFTIPLNKLEYISLGYMLRIVLPWNRRSETTYRREVPLSLIPSASPGYEEWSATDGGYLLDMIMAGYKRELQLLNDSLSMVSLMARTQQRPTPFGLGTQFMAFATPQTQFNICLSKGHQILPRRLAKGK